MSLPIVKFPTYNTELGNDKIKFRNFNIEEHKSLLTAVELGDTESTFDTMVNIIKSCTFGKVDIEKLNQGQLEYLFLQIYIKSVKNKVEANFTCHQTYDKLEKVLNEETGEEEELTVNEYCGNEFKIVIPVEKAELKSQSESKEPISNKIKVFENIEIDINYPSAIQRNEIEKESMKLADEISEDESLDEEVRNQKLTDIKNEIDVKLIYLFIQSIKDLETDEVFDKSSPDFTYEKFKEWYKTLPSNVIDEIVNFIQNEPVLSLDYSVKCPKCKKTTKLEFRELQSFFV